MHLRVQIRRGEAVAVNCLKLLDRTAVGFKRQVEHSPAFAAYTLNRSAEQTLGVEGEGDGRSITQTNFCACNRNGRGPRLAFLQCVPDEQTSHPRMPLLPLACGRWPS